jgi:16S rRNA (cytosine967-C5)-methyltransferase
VSSPRSRAREAALAALVAVEEGAHLDRALHKADLLGGNDVRERALARRIIRGTLQARGRIDWILDRVLHRGGPSGLDPWTRNALRVGLYQILYLSSIPSRAAVHETVRIARLRGGETAAGLVNAVLRRVLRDGVPEGVPPLEEDPVGHLSVVESYPAWLVARWVGRLGVEKAAERLRAGNRTPPLSLRVLPPGDAQRAAREIEKEGRKVRGSSVCPGVLLLPDGGDPSTLRPFREGRVLVQDEGAALAGSAAGPVAEGARVLDLCAAPGGKLLTLAASGRAGETFTGMDRSPWRMGRLRDNRERLGLGGVRLIVADALRPPLRPGVRFDLVLVDAPCTGLGTLGRRADLRWRVREEDISRLAGLARRLLAEAAELVEPGGHLVYSTCTTEPEENEEVIAGFLRADRRYRVVPPEVPLPGGALGPDGTVRVLPEVHGCDGAFAARIRRVAE